MSEKIEKFASSARVLVVDRCLASRIAMRELLADLGVDPERIVLVKNLAEATKSFAAGIPEIVISEYLLDDGFGPSLRNGLARNAIFFLVSSRTERAAVAKAAEDEIDNFIFKPYSSEDFKTVWSETLRRRLSPESHSRWLTEGKTFLLSGSLEAASARFVLAKKEQAEFSSACAYLARIRRLRDELTQATQEYREGLGERGVHFQCLSGLYEVLLQQKSVPDAYRVLKKLVLSFPEHPERLSIAVSLAVHTGNLRDIDVFHEIYRQIHQKTPSLVNHLSSALSVYGRHHLAKRRPEAALTRFESAIEVSRAQPKFVAYIVNHLNQAGYFREAEALLDRYSPQALAVNQ